METPVTVPLYAYDDPATGERTLVFEPAALEDPEGEALTATTAEQILESLTSTERALLPHLDQPTEELCQIVGRDPIVAEAIAEGLKAKLRVALADDADYPATLAALRQLCVRRL